MCKNTENNKIRFYCHGVYGKLIESLPKTIIEGDVEGCVGIGRPRAQYTIRILKYMNTKNYKDPKELSYLN